MTEYKVSWTEPALDDLLQVVDFIAEDNPLTAERILEQLSRRAATLERMPQCGRKVPELCGTRVAAQRELIVRPWRLFYAIEKDKVY
ncbi:MAG TPA: type II toxin-antitoxin system RelE/ParE family toxin, partial [Rhodanobacteraceae bacterium]|nr:type II toxin-antitoxin system RelE/ParE family toxin [Rhodanobacteraceae bacterium]